MRKARLLCAAVLAGVGVFLSVNIASQSATPQTSPIPTFRAEVEYVEIDAIAADQHGRFVSDLRKEEFQILEDGKPQTISAFSLVEIPLDVQQPLFGAATGIVDSDIQTNERSFGGRLYVLMLDDLHTAPLRAPLVRKAAQDFITRHVGANDMMAVLNTGGRADATQDFTSNKRLLLSAVEHFTGSKLDSATMLRNEQFFGGAPAVNGRIADPLEMERAFNAKSTTGSLRQVAEWLGGIRGRRKTVVFISEGIDYDITDVFNNRAASGVLDEMRGAIAAATRSNVTIYAVDPRGLTAYGDEAIETGQFADQRSRTAQSDDAQSQARSGIGPGGLRSELRLSQDSLRTIAEETGGFAAVNSNDLKSAFDKIVADNSTYYALAYYPPSKRRDGRFHKIEVRTSRPSVTVRARRGYVAPKGNGTDAGTDSSFGASTVVSKALGSPLPATGVGLRVFAAPFKGVAPNASVVLGVELSGPDLSFVENRRVELSYFAADASGRVRAGKTDHLTLTLPSDVRTRVAQTGLRVLNRVNLPPGRFQLRVAAHDEGNGAIGTVRYDLEVPDFDKSAFSMSGLLLSSRSGAATMTARGDAELQKVLPAPPVSLRAFPQTDEVVVFAEIYDRGGQTPHVVDITSSVVSQAGTVAFEHSDQRSSAEFDGASGGYGHIVRVPMKGLAPGTYVLKVEARSRLGHSAMRQVPFNVIAP